MLRICIITLGCPKNTVESESIAGILKAKGFVLTVDINNCDYALVHTCSFIEDARKESIQFIKALIDLKKLQRIKKVFISGCLVQSEGNKIISVYPEVDGFIGTGELGNIEKVLSKGEGFFCDKPGGLLETKYPRLLSGKGASAYLRISEGCNHRCSFCSIPKLRGHYISRKIENIVDEADDLSQAGIKEIILIAQDTTSYGRDLYGRYALPKLIEKISAVAGVEWIRILYAYPASITRELLESFKNFEKLCKYIDIPLQHSSDRILKLMQRPVGARALVDKIKKAVPEINIRTSFITGFPGETKEDYKDLLDFVRDGCFDQLGVFEYSDNSDVKSFDLRNKIIAKEKAERKTKLLAEQFKVVTKQNKNKVGCIQKVLIDEQNGENIFFARNSYQAQEIDNKIIFKGKARIGAFLRAKITGYKNYDLLAEQI